MADFIKKTLGAAATTAIAAGAAKIISSQFNMSDIRGKFLPKDGIGATKTLTQATALAKPGEKDWRVKLSIPNTFKESRLMLPVMKTGGFTFPYTPSILMSHSAQYTDNNPAHTNYTFSSFNYSMVDTIQINGEFYVQNGVEAEYWVSCVHYLRSCTKMRYGEGSSDAGSPPPVVLLNGYGDFVFKNVPVIINNFNIDLSAEVDYIQTGLFAEAQGDFDDGTYQNYAWAPSQSLITIQVKPQYSRAAVSQFNMNNFVNGKYVQGEGGFI